MKLTPLCIRLIARIARSRSANVRLRGDVIAVGRRLGDFPCELTLSPIAAAAVTNTRPELPSLHVRRFRSSSPSHNAPASIHLAPTSYAVSRRDAISSTTPYTFISIPRVLINARTVLITRLRMRSLSPFRDGMPDRFAGECLLRGNFIFYWDDR